MAVAAGATESASSAIVRSSGRKPVLEQLSAPVIGVECCPDVEIPADQPSDEDQPHTREQEPEDCARVIDQKFHPRSACMISHENLSDRSPGVIPIGTVCRTSVESGRAGVAGCRTA